MTHYILHVAVILALCLLFYKVLLYRQTYYRLNRMVLLLCLVLAFVLPLIPVQQQFSLRNETSVVHHIEILTGTNASQTDKPPVTDIKPGVGQPNTVKSEAKPVTLAIPFIDRLTNWIIWIYGFGVIAFGANFLLQLVVLLYQSFKKPALQDGIYRIVELDSDKAPCSFGNSIFINPAKYDWETYSQILMHEKVHIRQGHTFDLILAEIMLVFQWFNPFAWLYRKTVESNLEFLTDEAVLQENKIEMAAYQLSLLKVSVPNFAMRLSTSYNQAFLKKRIFMMTAKRSNLHTMWKYFMMIPLLLILLCSLNQPIAQSRPSSLISENKRLEAKNNAIAEYMQRNQQTGDQTIENETEPITANSSKAHTEGKYSKHSVAIPQKNHYDWKKMQATFDSLKNKSGNSRDYKQLAESINILKAKLDKEFDDLNRSQNQLSNNPDLKQREDELIAAQNMLSKQMDIIFKKWQAEETKAKVDSQRRSGRESPSSTEQPQKKVDP